ncbi:MAG: ortho-chlorophenol reductive dehalogenase [Kordiimonas sp.]|nr:ortho-chlorophenol reductive dehalogenase [Kordiimonas sp.]
MGFFVGKQVRHHEYEPSVLTKWCIPEGVSGNTFNGLGRKDVYRAWPQMHGTEKHPWMSIVYMFLFRSYMGSLSAAISFFTHAIRDKIGHKKIADVRIEKTPEEFTAALKKKALAHEEVEVVGVTRMRKDWMFENQENLSAKYVVVLARSMDYDLLAKNLGGDFSSAITQVIGGYEKTQRAAVDLANWIRAQGWPATGYGGLTLNEGELHLMIPPAIEAGIGQLAKNGSMISDELGSAFRIATVMTDMPLIEDQPREIGVDEFCMSCKKCTEDCPPGAISDKKQMVRGVEKWYVDFDKCMPFITEHKACGICLSTCPWSRPGVATSLSKKMLKKMARKAENTM